MSARPILVVEDPEENFQTVLDAARSAGLKHPIVRAAFGGACLRLLCGAPRDRALRVLPSIFACWPGSAVLPS